MVAIPRLIVLSGLPRSGKSRLAGHLCRAHGFTSVCSDEIREEYGIEWQAADPRKKMINLVTRLRALEKLSMGCDVVIDTTGMYRRQRQLFLGTRVEMFDTLHRFRARRYLVSLVITPETWEQRQREAGRTTRDRAFYLDRFEPVSDDEVAGLDGFFRFENNQPDDFERITTTLDQALARTATG